MANLLQEPSFEESPTTWVLGTTCVIGTALIIFSTGHHGVKVLRIQSVIIGGQTRCGYAERPVLGLTVGKKYRVSVWYKDQVATYRRVAYLSMDGVVIGSFVGYSGLDTWKQYVSGEFTATATTMTFRLEQGTDGITQTFTRFYDDLWMDDGLPPDAASVVRGPGLLAAASDPSSQSGVLASPKEIRAVAQSLGMVASPSSLAVHGRASRLP